MTRRTNEITDTLPTAGTTAKPGRTGRIARRISLPLAALALTGAVGAVTVAQASASGTSTKAATPTCATAGLTASLSKHLAGGMNHAGAILDLKNTSGHTCALRGYPGLGLQDADGKTLTTKTHWGVTWYAADAGKKTLTLKNGQHAQAVIAWTHANTGTAQAKHAAKLIVTPPAATTHKTLKLDEWVDNGQLDVTSLAPSYKVD
ncbi:DUF4232 domain-containing protein [Streptomyces sp. SPB074]|uniref:DUF4232 domain-containing protein n=1 Tax=Streptomyces sp. (strain SPB074) TaxID=465543 RepID=UPI000565AE1E|nr:DUF4232 domain-containing protein [Streptomyces sp. SPB074]